MRKVRLFIAMSLDGYIADKNGGVEWLEGENKGYDDMESYHTFIKGIDTIIMGWNTYHQITEELSPQTWMYPAFTTYVLTHKEVTSSEKIIFTKEDICKLLVKLKAEEGKDIWVCGGANLVQQLVAEDRIDSYCISVIPVILGSGILLFDDVSKMIKLKVVRTQTYNGIIDLEYTRR